MPLFYDKYVDLMLLFCVFILIFVLCKSLKICLKGML